MGTPPGHLLEVPLDNADPLFYQQRQARATKGESLYMAGLKCGWNALHCVSKLPCNVVEILSLCLHVFPTALTRASGDSEHPQFRCNNYN
jgi:hypothetical protein